ncbi:MAG: hypothetical protein BJ554DRAFT_1140, partial [Olpidium bornovanus]
ATSARASFLFFALPPRLPRTTLRRRPFSADSPGAAGSHGALPHRACTGARGVQACRTEVPLGVGGGPAGRRGAGTVRPSGNCVVRAFTHWKSPFWCIDLQSREQARKLVRRAILVKSVRALLRARQKFPRGFGLVPLQTVYELWGTGKDLASLIESVKNESADRWVRNYSRTNPATAGTRGIGAGVWLKCARMTHPTGPGSPAQAEFANCRYRWDVITFGNTTSWNHQQNVIRSFHFIPLDGKVDLVSPEAEFDVIEDFGLLEGSSGRPASRPYRWFVGFKVCTGNRNLIKTYDLKKRSYLGNTAMDPELSLIMANLALVKCLRNPFKGTGTLQARRD